MKYIIIDPEEGVFLGTTGRNEIIDKHNIPDDARVIALFSSHNVFDLTKAAAFHSKSDAYRYMHHYIKKRCPDAFVAEIKSDKEYSPYAHVIEIVKAGYGEYVADMIDALPMDNQTIH